MAPITLLSQLDLSRRYTYADYQTWEFTEWVELIRGRIWLMSPEPGRVHQKTSSYFHSTIYTHLQDRTCEVFHAPFNVRLTRSTPFGDASIETVGKPDICVICDPAKLDARGCLGVPNWIIEILPPRNAAHDLKTRFDLYEESGVREYWFVDPGLRNVMAYTLGLDGRYALQGEYYQSGLIPAAALPELQVEWERVFEGV